jgi:hypothetical protein
LQNIVVAIIVVTTSFLQNGQRQERNHATMGV